MSTAQPFFVSAADYLTLPRAPETWIIEHLLPSGGSVLVYGDAKVGKSYASLQLMQALATDTIPQWLGFRIRTHGPVAYLQLDTPRSLWADRLEHLEAAGESLQHTTYPVALADRETSPVFPFNILNSQHSQLLAIALAQLRPIAVVVDTIREACTGADENDATEMQQVIAALTAAIQPAALILVAHPRKPSEDSHPSLINDPRGSNYLVGRMDAILRFTKHTLYYTSRSIEEGSMRLDRLDNGFWQHQGAEMDAHVEVVMADTTLTTLRARAKKLAELSGKREEGCRSYLRRLGY